MERIGGTVAYIFDLTITQLGPLVVFARLKDQTGLEREERRVLAMTEIKPRGGILQTISQSHKNVELTDDMVDLLNDSEKYCVRRAMQIGSASQDAPGIAPRGMGGHLSNGMIPATEGDKSGSLVKG